MFRLSRLVLTQFRNYETLAWRPRARLSVVTGPNGSGKTNLLEALSLLVPGRGLRRARLSDLGRHGRPWGVVARGNHEGIDVEIATGTPPEGTIERRVFRLDGAPVRNQADVAAIAAAVWLTPQMDRLFGETASGRRRFLDRLVWALEPGHAREVAAFETALASRNRLLAAGQADLVWLEGVEHSLARHAVAVTAARIGLVSRLNGGMADRAIAGFPQAAIQLRDTIADRLESNPALAVEDWLRTHYRDSRALDAAGPAQWGAHRADFDLVETETGLSAASASTGQQKSLLINVVLGHAGLVAAARGAPPLLLLDEPGVHLDRSRRDALWRALVAGSAQVVLTGTDREAFDGLAGNAEFLATGSGSLHADDGKTAL